MFNIRRRITNVKEHMNWFGGGSPETVEKLPEWMRPYIEDAMQVREDAYKAGKLDPYTGMAQETESALGGMTNAIGNLAGAAGAGLQGLDEYSNILGGARDIDPTGLQNAAAMRQNQEAAKRGAITGAGASQVGSGRTAVTDAQRSAINAAEFAKIDADVQAANRAAKMDAAGNIISGAGTAYGTALQPFRDMADIGRTREDYAGKTADSAYEALRRQTELYGVGSGATQQPTGGK